MEKGSDEVAELKRELVYSVFSNLQTLERCVTASKRMLAESTQESHEPFRAGVKQQERFTNTMRRTANKLQFELACENWVAAVRLLNVFYGLNHLVRPEIQTTYLTLSNRPVAVPPPHSAVVH